MRPSTVRRLTGLAVALAAAGAVCVTGQATAQARIPCRPSAGTTTIAASRKARLFSDERTDNDYACLYSSGRARYLSPAEHFEYPSVRFAAPYIAFVQSTESVESSIGVMNLVTGRERTYELVAPTSLVCAEVGSLVLRSNGTAAWIATNGLAEECGPVAFTASVEVRLADRHGLRVLESATGIVPTSLRLSGSLLHWVNSGQARSTTLD